VTSNIIVVDDEKINRMLLESYLVGTGYAVRSFDGAISALQYLREGGAADTILLDRMMPDMDGIAFMHALKAMEGRASVPVIMQTAEEGSTAVAEGIAAGAYYYLIKPFKRVVLLAIVARALADRTFYHGLEQTAAEMTIAMRHMDSIRLSFRTVDDVRNVSSFLASMYPSPEAAIMGLTELMLNAVEHGNLGITYAEKSELNRRGAWLDEVERRLELPEFKNRLARVSFERDQTHLLVTIEDMGDGFDWTPYFDLAVERAADSHGRGIAMSRLVSFDEVNYVAPGNKVICTKRA
jgi:CheY-like chemotaxis protein